MSRSINIAMLRCGIAAGALIVSSSAFAQEDSASTSPADVARAPTVDNPADIIVTARRTEERLQDVPISITVLNQTQLTQRNVAVATDLATYTPSLQVNQRFGPEKSNFSIRGFNQDANTAPTVGVYFAEVVGVRAQGGTTSGNTVGAGAFTDLANVQVLKGPQGTLFGRNTTGGAILLTPQRPTDSFGGYVEGTYGNYDQKRVQAAINVPLADTFKVRFAYERNSRDGYVHNVSGRGAKNYSDIDYSYYRLGILSELTPSLENYVVASYSNSHGNGYATKINSCATPTSAQNPLVTSPTLADGTRNPRFSGTRLLQALSCQTQLNRQNARSDGFYDVEVRNLSPFLNIKTWQVINTTTWLATDNITIKNIASYGEFREAANFDLGSSNFVTPNYNGTGGFPLTLISPALTTTGGRPGGVPIVVPAGTAYDRITLDTAGPNRFNSAEATATEELQIQGHSAKLDYVIGGYLEFSRPIGFSQGRTGIFLDCVRPQDITCTNPLLFGSISESSTKLSFNNHGVFAQATYKFTDQLSFTAGGRYTFDKIYGFTNSTRASFAANAGTGAAFIDPVSGRTIARACTDSFRHGPATGARPGLDRNVCITNITNRSNKPTWLFDLDYKPTQDLLVYGKYARGYRQGGINFTNPGVETWNPESLDAFEAGLKASFRGSVSGYLNVAAFYNKLKNQQIFAGLTPTAAAAATGVSGGAAIINAGRSRIYGLEADASALFFDSLRFDVGYAYVNTKVESVEAAAVQGDGSTLGTLLVGTPFGTIVPTVQAGSVFTNAPKHKVTVQGTYTLPLDESFGRLSIGATYVYSSSYINDGSVPRIVDGAPLGLTPATNLVNLNLDWRNVAQSPVDLSLFVTNLTKEKFNVASTGSWNSAGVGEILLNQPRFYGVRVRLRFGD